MIGDLGLITVEEAASACGVTPATVRQWVRRYCLPAVQWSGRTLVSELAVLDCERARRREPRGRPRRG